MQIFSTFRHDTYLELAITLLEEKGVPKENIYAVPLNRRPTEKRLFDTLHESDGVSIIDIAMALATAFSVIGASVGFILAWGPIYWGLIGALLGFLLGFLIKLLYLKNTNQKQAPLKEAHSEVILIVECEDNQSELVEGLLWEHLALGVAKMK